MSKIAASNLSNLSLVLQDLPPNLLICFGKKNKKKCISYFTFDIFSDYLLGSTHNNCATNVLVLKEKGVETVKISSTINPSVLIPLHRAKE